MSGGVQGCFGCLFFVRHTRFDPDLPGIVNLKTGDCRRMSPRARIARDGTPLMGFWPAVKPDDFCGEWKAGDRP